MEPEVVRILRCPITRGDLRQLTAQEIGAVNGRIAQGGVRYVGGEQVKRRLDEALVSSDGRYGYPVEDGIAVLLSDRAIALHSGDGDWSTAALGDVKAGNQAFYDEIGWQMGDTGLFADANLFEDLRPVSADYVHRCHLRVNRYLDRNGQVLLDAASGPVQFAEYLTYSEGYARRVCVDFSHRALVEARKVVGERGVYLLADVTNLPLHDSTADAVVSLHTIYHVPEKEQETAFREVHRVLAPGRRAVVVYAWRHSLLMRLFEVPMRALGLARRIVGRSSEPNREAAVADLYFRPKSHRWFANRHWGFRYEIAVWRSLSVPFLRFYVHERLLGRRFLAWVFELEERWPHLLGRLGQYPLIVIEK